jgi:two-component system phosphate regulon sensor histidine kinase PhoR
MSRRALRIIIFLAAISMVGITIVQVFWLKKAFSLKEIQFNHNVNLALTTTAQRILDYNNNKTKLVKPVNQLADDYFVVMVNDVIDANLLEFFLKEEFERRNIVTDFEYSIYDCMQERIVYGNYVSMNPKEKTRQTKRELPVWDNENYYFAVYFPNRDTNLVSQLGIWLFSTGVMVIVFVFFLLGMVFILKQKRLSEVQKDFVNNMTHEFKTPLSTIMVSTEVLLSNEAVQTDQRLQHYTKIIQSEANRLKKQVERVLQMASMDNHSLKLNLENIDLHTVISHTIASLEPVIKEKNGSVKLVASAEKCRINADPLHISNVIFNLIDNALKYCDKNPEVIITLYAKDYNVQITIKDNGIGIPKEFQTRIFEKFYRIPTGNVHNVKGFGLGLSYVFSVIKAHKGKITLESTQGQGSTFTLIFPQNLKN